MDMQQVGVERAEATHVRIRSNIEACKRDNEETRPRIPSWSNFIGVEVPFKRQRKQAPLAPSKSLDSGFINLPNELIHEILLQVPAPLSILRISITCKRLNEFVDERFIDQYISTRHGFTSAKGRSAKGLLVYMHGAACEVCNEFDGLLDDCLVRPGKQACLRCRALVTLDHAKTHYKVTENDLASLGFFIHPPTVQLNQTAPFLVYLLSQVKDAAEANENNEKAILALINAEIDGQRTYADGKLEAALAGYGTTRAEAMALHYGHTVCGEAEQRKIVEDLAIKQERTKALEAALKAKGLELDEKDSFYADYFKDSLHSPATYADLVLYQHIFVEHCGDTSNAKMSLKAALRKKYSLARDPRSKGGWTAYFRRKHAFEQEFGQVWAETKTQLVMRYISVTRVPSGPKCYCGRPNINVSQLADPASDFAT